MAFFVVYIDDKQNVSEHLMELLGFIDYASGSWERTYCNSAKVDELVHALTELGYTWVVEYEFGTDDTRRFDTLEEWVAWYEN